ncbi:uncharacterized protein [Branchiostoma lanceolatum]|uniref:uncharacterized protein n=1 Tax=Branchiostoma lanceolatum TaxID=7740 RepID=UPI003456DC5B
MPGGQQQSQTNTEGTTPMQQPQTDWQSRADAAANIHNPIYATKADATYDADANNKANRRSVCKRLLLTAGLVVGLVVVTMLSYLTVNVFSVSEEMAKLSAEMADMETEMAAKDQKYQQLQDEIDQLQTERAAKEQRIQVLEQRNYIERCESGVLSTPRDVNILKDGSGTRYQEMTATFSKAFRTTPVVTIGFMYLDTYRHQNTRIRSKVQSKSTTGLTVCIETWEESRLYLASVYWMACA